MKILLATGRKAEAMVKDAVKASNSSSNCDVLTQGLGIAAFSTPESLRKALKKHFSSEKEYDLILVSGLCKADFSYLEKEICTTIRLGPRHAYDLGEALQFVEELEFSPRVPADVFLTEKRRENAREQLSELERGIKGKFSIKGVKIGGGARMKVCAEIVDATQLNEQEIHRKMRYFMENGADIIDIGVHIGAKQGEVKKAVKMARAFAPDVPISVDTLDAELIRAGIETGADMVLSVNTGNIAKVGDEIGRNNIAAVVIPDFGASDKNESLVANVKMAKEHGIKRIIADPVLNAVGYGIAESLYNYYLFRQHDKNTGTPLFFGVGNVTELMDADSVGVNATLAGIASELSADILFTPEYSDKARGSTRELRIASEMMALAKARKSSPKDLGLTLLILKEKRRKPVVQLQNIQDITKDKDTDSELVVAKGDTKWRLDPKGCFRIGICEVEAGDEGEIASDSDRKIYAEHLPTGKRIVGETAKEVMDTILRLDMVSMLEHASYLSIELTNAELALRLNRGYEQDEELFYSHSSNKLQLINHESSQD